MSPAVTTRRTRRGSADISERQRAAAVAQLRHVNDSETGIRRIRQGTHFRYVVEGGQPVRQLDVLRRIKRIAIPPAWTDVWICRDPDGHVQAVGRDGRGRRQYRYHARWRAVRDGAKYGRLR